MSFKPKEKKIVKALRKERFELNESYRSNREVDDTLIPYRSKEKKIIKSSKK